MIVFSPLSQADIKQIVELQIEGIKKMLAGNSININVSEYAVEYLAEKGYDPVYGARPLKRIMQRELLNALSKQIIAGNLDAGQTVIVDCFGEGLVFKNRT